MCYSGRVLKLISAPVTNDRGPRYMERALAAIHQAQSRRQPVEFHYATIEGRVGLFVECPTDAEERVLGPIIANYPNCGVTDVEGFDARPDGWETWSAELTLVPELFPILRHAQFEDMLNGNFADPITAILRAVTPGEFVRPRIAISLAPASSYRVRVASRALRTLDREFFRRRPRCAAYYASRVTRRRGFPAWLLGLLARCTPQPTRSTLDTSAGRLHDREEHLQAASDKVGGHLFEVRIRLIVEAPPSAEGLARDRLRQMAGALGAFTRSQLATFRLGAIRRGPNAVRSAPPHFASHEELATLFHPPTASAAAERMQTADFLELEPPPKFYSGEEAGAVTLGRVRFRNDNHLIGLGENDRRRHVYIVGASGTGKSTLLLNLIRQDMQANRGLTVIDVHGDLADAAKALVPKHRKNDMIVFDPTSDRVLSFNPLACPDLSKVDQVTSGVVSAFKKLYDSWGPRLENLLRYAIFVTVEQQGTLLDMLRLLTDKGYRDQTVQRVADDVVRSFWTNEFASWNTQYRTEAVSSVTNKLMPFLTSRHLRAVTAGDGKSSLDLRRVMDEGRVLIISLSRGRLGQDNATLLGSLLLTAIEQTALSRADLAEEQRRDHYLYLDEFQSLVTPSTGIILSEARKYRLSLMLSHQFTQQLDEATFHAVTGNCGTLLAFRVGIEDAERLAPAFSKHHGQLLPSQLCNLPNYNCYARLLIEGVPANPCSISTCPSQGFSNSGAGAIMSPLPGDPNS